MLGITGGLVPCPAGVTLVIFSLSFEEQNTLKCFTYLSAFSVGLASVLIFIALSMVLSKKLLIRQKPKPKLRRFLQVLPLISSVLICLVGAFIVYRAFHPELEGPLSSLLGG